MVVMGLSIWSIGVARGGRVKELVRLDRCRFSGGMVSLGRLGRPGGDERR